MKTLYLLRHAKSSWSFDELSDQERPLNDRGRDDAPLMGQALAKRRICPDIVVSSPAVRAMNTAVLVAREMQYPHDKIKVEPGIYGADVDDFLAIIKDLPDSAASALVVGHNPTITETANELSPSSLNEMPTAAVVCLRFACEHWAEVSKVNAEFYFYDYPRNAE
ncbi:SixA phosphatase family protein [Hymenobacter siberiensis]|jgi:phosphohistidine phosphatase|uniref:SixA phosphatase family protein n=1 Tax=Hymenobacter siberiensis TaxID=2848396 RepID=UPI001C1E0051|nr:histidine phosphatase family protein [Hymenobacter siberiensis]MBU6119415.1 histidine phosphatase family protein [Hymenobacter siberiensis]